MDIRRRADKRRFSPLPHSLVIRIGMFCILCSVQAVYLHFKTLPSWIALAGGLPILAALMVIEILLQGAVEWVRGSLAAKRSRRS